MPFRRGHLRYFIAVAEEGQVTRAADKMNIAQPALSQAIAQLEGELGVQLLERHARGVSLTPSGEVFLEKARLAVNAEMNAATTAQALLRAAQRTIAFGYVGLPPGLTNPDLMEAIRNGHSDFEISLKEIPFPSTTVASWLAEVDVAITSLLTADPHVWVLPVRSVPRVVLAPTSHPLAERRDLTVAEVLDETFIGFDQAVDPVWAGFFNLDDHRGEPPPNVAISQAATPPERFMTIGMGRAITTVAACHAEIITKFVHDVVAIPLRDADPVILSLYGHEGSRHPAVEDLRAVARSLADDLPPALPTRTPQA
jgi:DNA-binding transcriptional LysR family regulator